MPNDTKSCPYAQNSTQWAMCQGMYFCIVYDQIHTVYTMKYDCDTMNDRIMGS